MERGRLRYPLKQWLRVGRHGESHLLRHPLNCRLENVIYWAASSATGPGHVIAYVTPSASGPGNITPYAVC